MSSGFGLKGVLLRPCCPVVAASLSVTASCRIFKYCKSDWTGGGSWWFGDSGDDCSLAGSASMIELGSDDTLD